MNLRRLALVVLLALVSPLTFAEEAVKRLLYVATPGVRNDLQYGGHGVLVFDIDAGFKFVKRIASGGVDKAGVPLNVKGVCASVATGRIYVSTPVSLEAIDLVTEKSVWERKYPGGCDRMSITPDSKAIYLPSFEGDHWNVVDPLSGDVIAKIEPKSGAHNTVVSLDGRWAYLAGLKSKVLTIADARAHKAERTIGFTDNVRPLTVTGDGRWVYACVNGLLGFEVGDAETGKMVRRVTVEGFKKGPVLRHGCPSHGVALSPDEREAWVCDAFNKRLHVFDVSGGAGAEPKQLASVELKGEPGWVTFTLDGKYAIPSTGDVIDAATRKVVCELKDEHGQAVQSEKLVEIHVAGGKPVAVGNQFGVGRVSR